MATPRSLRARATASIVVAPATVTDRTCAAVLGLEPRAYRAWLAAAGIPHARIGRRVVARVDDVLAAVTRLASTTTTNVVEHDDDDEADDQPETADDVLARLGLRRIS